MKTGYAAIFRYRAARCPGEAQSLARRSIFGITFALGAFCVAHAQPTITPIHGLGPAYGTYPTAVSNGGSTVVGASEVDSELFPTHAWRWTGTNTLDDLGYIPQDGGPTSYGTWPNGVSDDGSVVVGFSIAGYGLSGNLRAFRWTLERGIEDLGNGEASGVSGNGAVVVGYANNCCGTFPMGACRWHSDGRADEIGSLRSDGLGAFPQATNFDGSVVVGYSAFDFDSGNVHAFRWDAGIGMRDLGLLPGGTFSWANAVSADGSTIVGHGDTATSGLHAFRWTQAEGMQDLGILPGGADYASARGVSHDGRIVIGRTAFPGTDERVFVWTPARGMFDLGPFLLSQDVDTTAVSFSYAESYGMSPDGSSVVFWSPGVDASGTPVSAWLVRGLAFDCLDIQAQPAPQIACPQDGVMFSVSPVGSGPFSYTWQIRAGVDEWTTLRDDRGLLPCGGDAQATPSNASTTTISISPCPGQLHYFIRCIANSPCGNMTSDEAALNLDGCPTCYADFNQDGGIDGADVEAFFAAWEGGDSGADVNQDGGVDGADVGTFFAAWEAGGCG